MTSPSAPGSSPTPELTDPGERGAFALVPSSLGPGIWAEPYDHSGRQGAVDFLLHYPGGRIAAMEVTTAVAPGVRQLYKLLADAKPRANPGNWVWWATIDDPRDVPDLIERVGPHTAERGDGRAGPKEGLPDSLPDSRPPSLQPGRSVAYGLLCRTARGTSGGDHINRRDVTLPRPGPASLYCELVANRNRSHAPSRCWNATNVRIAFRFMAPPRADS